MADKKTTKSAPKIKRGPLKHFGGIRKLSQRAAGSEIIHRSRDRIANDLLALWNAKITDVVIWDDTGQNFAVKPMKEIPEAVQANIKRIRIQPNKDGLPPTIDVEMWDKMKIGQILAKSAGLLEQEKHSDTPAVIDVKMVGPDEKDTKIDESGLLEESDDLEIPKR